MLPLDFRNPYCYKESSRFSHGLEKLIHLNKFSWQYHDYNFTLNTEGRLSNLSEEFEAFFIGYYFN